MRDACQLNVDMEMESLLVVNLGTNLEGEPGNQELLQNPRTGELNNQRIWISSANGENEKSRSSVTPGQSALESSRIDSATGANSWWITRIGMVEHRCRASC